MLVADLSKRISGRVPALAGRVEGAAELAELVRNKALPQASPFAFVVPTGLRGQEADAMAGAYTQVVEQTFAVILVVRAAGDPKGMRAYATIDQLIWAVIRAVCGWAPDDIDGDDDDADAIADFRLLRGQLLSLAAGTVQFQLDFAIQGQTRILS